MLLAFLPRFEKYRDNLEAKRDRSAEEGHVLKTVGVLIDYLRKDYSATLSKVANHHLPASRAIPRVFRLGSQAASPLLRTPLT